MKSINKIGITVLSLTLMIMLTFAMIQTYATDESVNTNEGMKIENVRKAIQEVAYSYYMRSTNIQYNSMKGIPSWYSPEEATSQNMNYIVCSAFTKNVYNELLGIKIPETTSSLITYGKENIGAPEVIAYGSMQDDNFIMKFYDKQSENNVKSVSNPSLQNIIPYLQVRRCTYLHRAYYYGL